MGAYAPQCLFHVIKIAMMCPKASESSEGIFCICSKSLEGWNTKTAFDCQYIQENNLR